MSFEGPLGWFTKGTQGTWCLVHSKRCLNDHVNKDRMCTNQCFLVWLIFVNEILYKLFLYLLEKSFAKLFILLNVVSCFWRSWLVNMVIHRSLKTSEALAVSWSLKEVAYIKTNSRWEVTHSSERGISFPDLKYSCMLLWGKLCYVTFL